ncbi:MAG: hypothetical protein HY064_07585 [Bacteroidetes bacterium]|nr:hypothetical protein [Bacteroidota bacterium]
MKKQSKPTRAEILKQAQRPAAKISKAKHAAEEDDEEDLPVDEYEKPDEDDEASDIDDDSKMKLEDVSLDDLDLDDEEEYYPEDF